MQASQFEIWMADISFDESQDIQKTLPVVVVQTNLLNKINHNSILICPITSIVKADSEILRVHLTKEIPGIVQDCDIMVDQVRTINFQRLKTRLGALPEETIQLLKSNIKIVLDL